MNVVEPRSGLAHHAPPAARVLQHLHATRVWNGQRPASVAMDTAAAAAAVASDAVFVERNKIGDAPIGEIRHSATSELYSHIGLYITIVVMYVRS